MIDDLEEILRSSLADGPPPRPAEDLAVRASRDGVRLRHRRRIGAAITTLALIAVIGGLVVSRPEAGITKVSVAGRPAATAPTSASPVSLPACAAQQVTGCEVRRGRFAVTVLDTARATEALSLLPVGFRTVEIGHQIISGGGSQESGTDATFVSAAGKIRVVWSYGATPTGSQTGAVFMAAQDGSLAAIASSRQRFVVLTETPPTGSRTLPLPRTQLAHDARQLVDHYKA